MTAVRAIFSANHRACDVLSATCTALRYVLLLTLTFGTASTFAAVSASVHPPAIDELETARLSLQVTGNAGADPDLSPLEQDFEILSTHTASRFTLSNAGSESAMEYTITLRPKRAGTLTIPPLQIGQEQSTALTLRVSGTDPALRSAVEGSVFFEVSVSRNPVYTQGETILTRRLFYSEQSQIYSDLPGPPELSGAEVFAVGATRSYTSIRDGDRFEVIEQQFAIFPSAPGRLTIPSISITTSVRIAKNGAIRRVGARVVSPTIDIEALPIPADWPADLPWLPAESVDISDRWSPATDTLATGDPLEREVIITVEGNLAASITPIADDLPGTALRQYPEPPVLEDNRDGTSIVGTRRSRYTLMAAEPGIAIVPALRVTWWDVNARRMRVAESGSRTITLTGATSMSSATQEDTEPNTAATPPAEPVALEESADSVAQQSAWLRLGVITLMFLLVAGAIVMLLRITWRRYRTVLRLRHGRLGRFVPTLRQRGALFLTRRRLLRALERGDLGLADAALRRYLELRYERAHGTPEALFRADGGAEVLRLLAGARFGSPSLPPPTARQMQAVLDGLAARQKTQPEALPPLFPVSAPH